MGLTITRTFKEALNNFLRNGWLTVATVLVLILSLYVVAILYTVTYAVNGLLKNTQDKLSVSVYFKADTTEKTIMDTKEYLLKNRETASADYVSKEKAFEDFKKYNANDQEVMESLEEIGENPLWASLVVKAVDPEKYESIVGYTQSSPYREEISRINYAKTREAIEKLNGLIHAIKRAGVSLSSAFALIAILITFNTIRVTIYAHRKEIEIMRLVGASNSYIRWPFIFEGLIYGLGAAIISMLFLLLTLRFATPIISKMIPTQNLMSFYLHNFFSLFGIQAGLGIVLGVASSLIAMRRYLKV